MSSVYEAGSLYNSLKLHFNNENYNFLKYNGKTKCKFIPENQFYIFQKLEKRYGENLKYFYVSNFLENPKIWINDLLSQEADDVYKNWQKKKESLGYIFKNDISLIFEDRDNLNDVLLVKKDFPILMKMVMQKKVSLETLLILDDILQFIKVWEKKINDELIWKGFRLKCIKYKPFLIFDTDKMKTILKQEVKRLS
jgi:hypothetical protein